MDAPEAGQASGSGRCRVAKRLVVLALIALTAGGCAYMRFDRPPAQDLAQCGVIQIPFWYRLDGAQDVVYSEEYCMELRLEQGYQPALPEPYFFFISSGSLYTGEPSYTKMP
jgi:hypothetical protein